MPSQLKTQRSTENRFVENVASKIKRGYKKQMRGDKSGKNVTLNVKCMLNKIIVWRVMMSEFKCWVINKI